VVEVELLVLMEQRVDLVEGLVLTLPSHCPEQEQLIKDMLEVLDMHPYGMVLAEAGGLVE
jgi:hypothetical protein